MNANIDVLKVEDSEKVLEKVATQLNTTLKQLDKDVIVLQEWLNTQQQLPKMLDSYSLRNFLILNKSSIEVAKQKINNYYTFRSKMEEVWDDLHPKNAYHKKVDDMMYLVVYPGLTPELHKLCYLKVKDEKLMEQCEPLDGLKKLVTIQEIRLREDILFGDILVADFKGVPPSVLLKLTPTLVYKATILIYQGIYSFRLKALYVVNTPPYFQVVLSILKKIIKPKIFDRIHVFNDLEALKDYIPEDMLPRDMGGKGFSCEELNEALEKKFLEYRDLFDRLKDVKTDKSLRPEELKNKGIDVYGNFKKLDFD